MSQLDHSQNELNIWSLTGLLKSSSGGSICGQYWTMFYRIVNDLSCNQMLWNITDTSCSALSIWQAVFACRVHPWWYNRPDYFLKEQAETLNVLFKKRDPPVSITRTRWLRSASGHGTIIFSSVMNYRPLWGHYKLVLRLQGNILI